MASKDESKESHKKTDKNNNKEAPTQLVKEVLVHENKWVKYYFDEVKSQSNKDSTKWFNHRYNRVVQKDGIPGSVVLALNESKEIAFVRQYRYPTDSWELELPRGFGEENIDGITNAKKELAEEMNCEISKDGKIECIGEINENSGLVYNAARYYLCTNIKPLSDKSKLKSIIDDHDIEFEGIEEKVFIPYGKVKQLIKNGTIKDAFTLVALQLALVHNPKLFE